MADKSVGLKCDVKKIFDKDLTKAVLAQIKETIEASVKGAKGLVFDEKAKSGWLLTATVTSLELEDDTLSIKISIDGVSIGGSASGFSANGNRKVSGINTKKIESEVTTLVNDAFENLMKSKVIKVLQDN